MTQSSQTPRQGHIAYRTLAPGAQAVQASQNDKRQHTSRAQATQQPIPQSRQSRTSVVSQETSKKNFRNPAQASGRGNKLGDSMTCSIAPAVAPLSNRSQARNQTMPSSGLSKTMSYVAAPMNLQAVTFNSVQSQNFLMSFVAQSPSNTHAMDSSFSQAQNASHGSATPKTTDDERASESPRPGRGMSQEDSMQNSKIHLHSDMASIPEDVQPHHSEDSDTKVVSLPPEYIKEEVVLSSRMGPTIVPPECIKEEIVRVERELAPCESSMCPLKLALFDFDCTLTCFHVFGSLAGAATSKEVEIVVPPPKARTEVGQMSRLCALDNDHNWGPGVFALKAFGGKDRVSRLRSVLQDLENYGVECIILSRGMVGPMTKCLTQVNLLSFFSQIIGNLGANCGCTEYDHNVPARACEAGQHLLGKPNSDIGDVWKIEHIKRLMEDRALKHEQVVYMDDSLDEIKAAQGHCRRIHVAGNGAEEKEFKVLQQVMLAGIEAGSAVSESSSTDAIGEMHEQPKVPEHREAIDCKVMHATPKQGATPPKQGAPPHSGVNIIAAKQCAPPPPKQGAPPHSGGNSITAKPGAPPHVAKQEAPSHSGINSEILKQGVPPTPKQGAPPHSGVNSITAKPGAPPHIGVNSVCAKRCGPPTAPPHIGVNSVCAKRCGPPTAPPHIGVNSVSAKQGAPPPPPPPQVGAKQAAPPQVGVNSVSVKQDAFGTTLKSAPASVCASLPTSPKFSVAQCPNPKATTNKACSLSAPSEHNLGVSRPVVAVKMVQTAKTSAAVAKSVPRGTIPH